MLLKYDDDLFFFKQKTAYEMRISDWSSDVCSSDLVTATGRTWIGKAIVGHALLYHRFQIHVIRRNRPVGRDIARCAKGNTLHPLLAIKRLEIGRASCRERVCQYV